MSLFLANLLFFIEGLEIDFYNPRSLIVFICILQGAIFAALLLRRYFKERKLADFWLAALLLFLCSSLVTPLIGFANIYDRNQWLTYFPFGIAYSYGVCVYLYVLNLTNSKRAFFAKDLILFVPSLIYVVFRLILFAQDLEFKDWFDKNYYEPFAAPFIFITEFLWNAILLYLSIRHYRNYRKWLDENYSDTEKIKFDWLRNFLYLVISLLVLGALFDFTKNFIFNLSFIQYFYFEAVAALGIYYLAVAGYLRSQTIELNFTEAESEKIEAEEEDTKKTLLAADDLEKLKIKLQTLMETEKPFLDSQLTLANLAKRLGINSAVLSYAINSGFGVNFNDFVNGFRIKEVTSKLQNGAAKDENLLTVAFDSGFNSKATFNRAFKKFTGVSPKEFQND